MDTPDPKIRCMNCGEMTLPKDGDLYLGVFVCPMCKGVAEILRKRARKELKHLLTLLDETIRLALVEGRLKLGEQDPQGDKRKVLMTIVDLLEAKNGTGIEGRSFHGAGRRSVQGEVPEL